MTEVSISINLVKKTQEEKNILRAGPYAPHLCKVVGYPLDVLC